MGRVEFAYLVLGRQCAVAGFEPPASETICVQIRQIRSAGALREL